MTEKVVDAGEASKERIQRILNTPHPEPEFSDVVRKAFYAFNDTLYHIRTYDDRCMKVALVTGLEELGYIEAGASTLKAHGTAEGEEDFAEVSRCHEARLMEQRLMPLKGFSEEEIRAAYPEPPEEALQPGEFRTYKPPEPLKAGEVRICSAEFADLHLYDPDGRPDFNRTTNELSWPRKDGFGLRVVGTYHSIEDAEDAAERLSAVLKAVREADAYGKVPATAINKTGAFITAYEDLPRLEHHERKQTQYLVVFESNEETAFFRPNQITSVEMMQFAVRDRKEPVRGSEISLADGRTLVVREGPGVVRHLAMK
jgi:hypothetical protein